MAISASLFGGSTYGIIIEGNLPIGDNRALVFAVGTDVSAHLNVVLGTYRHLLDPFAVEVDTDDIAVIEFLVAGGGEVHH